MIYVIADDLTGACDTGACFAKRGLRTAVRINEKATDDAPIHAPDVLVFNTDSRYMPEEQAVRAIQTVAWQLQASPVAKSEHHLIYKKIDSTMRGHPSAELYALLDTLQIVRALVTPAFPAQERTVSGGQLLVQGQPLSQSPFAHEGACGDLCEVFDHPGQPLRLLGRATYQDSTMGQAQLRERGVTIADAQTDSDLMALAQQAIACGVPLLCGSAGLATALAEQIAPAVLDAVIPTRAKGATLVVAGSLHPATARQVKAACEHGVPIVQPTAGYFEEPGDYTPLADELAALLEREGRVIVSTAGMPELPRGRQAVATRLGELVAQVATRSTIGRLVLTGGDVAMAVCTSLGAGWLTLSGELQPGIAIGQLAGGPYVGLQVVTKAGGFGQEDALLKAL